MFITFKNIKSPVNMGLISFARRVSEGGFNLSDRILRVNVLNLKAIIKHCFQ